MTTMEAPPRSAAAPRYPIRVAARRGGVSVPTLRAWERRHGAVRPARSAGEQRLYSDDDVHRIALFGQLTAAGHVISAIAGLETAELERLVAVAVERGETAPIQSTTSAAPEPASQEDVLDSCMRAVFAQAEESLYRLLLREAVRLESMAFVERVAAPLSRRLGDEWAGRRITEAQERIASSVIRRVLGFALQALVIPEKSSADGRRVLITTTNGERHENGVLMAGVVAALAGCHVVYPGADLPAAAIAAAARTAKAEVVALSILDGGAARAAGRELVALRRALPQRARIVVGGSGAALIDDAILAARAIRIDSLDEWREMLAAPRRRRVRPS